MEKTFIQGVIIVLSFFGIWFGLQQVDWMNVFRVEHYSDETEEKLGEIFWEMIESTEEIVKDKYLVSTVDSLVNKICIENDIDRESLKVHILLNDEINAFALPDGHLVINTGLIASAENHEELCGVIGHEIAHIELNHIMQKLVKEIGLSALLSIATGGRSEIIGEAAHVLSSSAFDRKLEEEADIKAVDYLTTARIDPEPLANFMFKLAEQEPEFMEYFSWVSTHPDSKDRALYIIEYSKSKKVKYEPVIKTATWEKAKAGLSGLN